MKNPLESLGGQAGNKEKCYSSTIKHVLLLLASLHPKESWRLSTGRESSTMASAAPQFDPQGREALILLPSLKKKIT